MMARSGAFHIHLLNSPDTRAYAVPPRDLQERLKRELDGRISALKVSESDDNSAVTEAMRDADAMVCFRLPKSRLGELAKLKWIHLISAGVDHLLPLDWLPDRIALTNNSGVHGELAGEYAACALLMLNIGIPNHATQQRLGGWDRQYNDPIKGKTVLIVGVGAIGGAAATRAKALGLRVLGVRRSGKPHPDVDEMYTPDDLPRLLPQVDFLMVTAALTPETRGMIGEKELALLPRRAGLVNMARAAIVDYDALARMLDDGRLRGAVVDVCKPEPLPAEAPLRSVRGLLITPHISSDPLDYAERTIDIIAANVTRMLDGQPLLNRVDPTRGY